MKVRKSMTTKMAEEEALRWLVRINKETISETERQCFLDWLNSSSLNQAAYIKAEKLWSEGRHYAAVSRRQPVRREWQYFAVACSFLLVMFVGIHWFPTSTQHYETLLGQQQVIDLEDGSRITLNTQTQIDVVFTERKREVYLKNGEAFFDVKPDSTRPFDVIVKSGVVRVLGTHFSVYSTKADALVQVESGKVALGKIPFFSSNYQAALVLSDNQRQSFFGLKEGGKVESINPVSAFAWRNKRLIYQSLPLKEVVADLSRYIEHPIIIENEKLAETKVTAIFQLDDLRSSTQVIQNSLGVKMDFNQHTHSYVLTK